MQNQPGSLTDASEASRSIRCRPAARIARSQTNHSLHQLAWRFRATTLVFENGQVVAPDPTPNVSEWIDADHQSVNSLFADYPIHRKIFSRFLDDSFIGLFLVHRDHWISYGWSSQPGQKQPPHLPPWVSHLSAYWVFYCHTKEEFRGRGFYKQLLARMVDKARHCEPNPTVYVDAFTANTASRRSIVSAGFNPAGVLTTYKFWVPRIAQIAVAGSWRRQQQHPPL